MKNIIMIPQGWEIDKEKSNEREIHLKETKKPKWEDFGEVSGYYIYSDICMVVEHNHGVKANHLNRLVFPTQEEAKACLALSQLLQWRDKYNKGWKPNWSDADENKYTIFFDYDEITTESEILRKSVLSFKTAKIRDKFLEDFRELIEIAKPLL